MPRIDPLKLLVCLSVLLAPNGGIRSANEVKRLANLMAKFSKKLVSKCIYIQILKCTETELLGQFMAAGGWSLVHMWLADGITTKNWPLIQELLELLLCCPVDVERLKSNTAPKLVKTLSKDSSHEGVRLLATKLVEQWLKIARNDIRSGNQQQQQQSSQQSSPAQQSSSSSLDDKSRNPEDAMSEDTKDVDESSHEEEVLDETTVVENGEDALDAVAIESADAEHTEDGVMEETAEGKNGEGEEDVEETKKAFNTAVADSNSKKTPLLFKITMKNGKQVLAKVESPTKKSDGDDEEDKPNVEEGDIKDEVKQEEQDQTMTEEGVPEVEETDSMEKLNKSVSDNGEKDEKKDKSEVEKEKDKDRRKSVEKDRSKDSKDKSSSKDKDKHRDKKSSSSGHRSSSSKSSSSSSKHNSSTGSNSSKSKSSSLSSSGKSSSSSSKDKDKEKDRNNSSSTSSSKHHNKHSSSSKSSSRSSSSSSNDKHREHKDKEKTSHSSKDKEGQPKISSPSSSSKLDKIPKKSRDGADEKSDSSADNSKPSPANSNKKASISIEVRNSEHRPKTVKTFNSQFRSHGLIEEAPPPPSRKGLKKPSTTATSGVVGSTATGTVHTKRSSPPPSSKEGPPEKKAREDPAERPGAIKLIPPKRQPSLIESDMFMDALSATLKKDVKKRKRKLSGSEPGKAGDQKAPSTPTTPTTPTPEKPPVAAKATSPEKTILPSPPSSPTREEKVPATSTTAAAAADAPSSPVPAGSASPPPKVVAAPMSFYRDTLADSEENAEDKKEQPEEKSEPEAPAAAAVSESAVETKPEAIPDTPAEPDNDDEDDDVVKKPKRLKSELIEDDDGDDRNNLIDAVGDDVAKKMEAEVPEKKLPGPGCGPDGPPGVLVIHRRKGPKKQLKWKAQEDLEEVRYFELDVTERCNVTRTFTDLKHLERVDERNKYMLARKVDAEDMMVERTAWLPLMAIDNVPPHPEGVNSQERRIQQNRERTILQALYFNRHMIPDSPAEPDVEVYSISEPVHIPMDDVTGNPDSINDFTNMPWPEPKSTPPHESAGFNSPFFPGSGTEFPPFGNTNNWELPGANPGPLPGMFPPNRMGQGMPPMGGNNGPPPGAPPMMRQMNMPSNNMPHNMPPNMGPPHPNMFQNNYARGPHPMQQHMNDRDDETFRNGPPPPPAWFGGNSREGNNRGPPAHQGNFNNRGGGGGRSGGNWNNNRDHDRSGPRGSNYRPPWLNNNRGNQNSHRAGGRKW